MRKPFDVKEVIASVVDDSDFDEFKAILRLQPWSAALHAFIGYPVGIVANNGILFSESAQKGAHFIELCVRSVKFPCCFCKTSPALWWVKNMKHEGIAKHGAKMVTGS